MRTSTRGCFRSRADVTSEANLVLSIARELEPLATRALSTAGVALKGVIK